jgi:hypothetical protein
MHVSKSGSSCPPEDIFGILGGIFGLSAEALLFLYIRSRGLARSLTGLQVLWKQRKPELPKFGNGCPSWDTL